MDLNRITRRDAIGAAGVALSAMAAAEPAAGQDAAPAATSDRFVVGVIGPGGMGTFHLKTLIANPQVDIAYVCDPDSTRAATAAKTVESAGRPAPKIVGDMRQVLDDKAVEAVWVATPDHWHGPAAILAADAGKHVYVEKPCCHNIREGRLMIEAARRNKRVMQVGTQSRSTAHVRKAMEVLSSGAIGEILSAKVWNSQRRRNIGHVEPTAAPANLDFDTWTGPAPLRPYQTNLLHANWRWFHNFGCGDMGNDGVHNLDIGVWGLGVTTHPSAAAALGGKYAFDDDQQFPDTQCVVFEYSEGDRVSGKYRVGQKKQLIFEQRIWAPYKQEGYENGNAFYGTKGCLIMGHTVGWTLYGERNTVVDQGTGTPDLPAHHQNFFECIRSGAKPHADIEIGHLSATLTHLGNIATRLRKTLEFDPQKERITNDEAADALVRREYREHWGTPQGA